MCRNRIFIKVNNFSENPFSGSYFCGKCRIMDKRNLESTEKKKAAMLIALESNFGNVRNAAKMVKIDAVTHYRWLKEDNEYAGKSESIKDISFRNIKEKLLDMSMKMAEKGNVTVLNQLLRIYCKNIPEDMQAASFYNNVRIRMVPKFVYTPQDPTRIDHIVGKEEYERRVLNKDKE